MHDIKIKPLNFIAHYNYTDVKLTILPQTQTAALKQC